jgi:Putative beta-barrel porin-2, OmpL-like. bbp2
LNLLKGDLTILALTHIGKALPSEGDPGFFFTPVKTRYYGDIVATYKVSKKLTATYEFNYVQDDTPNFGSVNGATAYGIADYWVYALADNMSIGLRSEWFRDNNGAFVFACPGNLDPVKAEEGQQNNCFNGSPYGTTAAPLKGTNYYEETLAVNLKPDVGKTFEGMVIRPEVRWDYSTDTTPYDTGTSHDQWTFGMDVTVPVAFAH